MASCKSCEAPIVWAETVNGKTMPLDAEPSKLGLWTLVKGQVRRATSDDCRLLRPLYTAHWATCPNADSHRKEQA